MKSLLIALLLSLFTMLPACAKDYVAVFSSGDFGVEDWRDIDTSIVVGVHNWCPLEAFLQSVKQQSNGSPIVLDFQVHGSPDGTLSIQAGHINGHPFYFDATMGYVLNRVDKILGSQVKAVIFESCFGSTVYKKSIRNNTVNHYSSRVLVEDHPGIPSYPVYGTTGSYVGYNNFVFLQYLKNTKFDFIDMRECDKGYTPKPVVTEGPTFERNAQYFAILMTLQRATNKYSKE